MKLIDIKNIDKKELDKFKKIYISAFKENKEYVESLFSSFAKNIDFWYQTNDKNDIQIFIVASKKRIIENDWKHNATFISSVIINEKYIDKKSVESILNNWLEELKMYYGYIFIHFNLNKYFNNQNLKVSTIKSEWFLRKDQFLKHDEIYENIDYELMNKTYLDFLSINEIENYLYKTSKEYKAYYKMLQLNGYQIIQSKKAWVVVKDNIVKDFAYVDLKEFIRLMSRLPLNTIIESYFKIDKRFFVQQNNEQENKNNLFALKADNQEFDLIYFNDCF